MQTLFHTQQQRMSCSEIKDAAPGAGADNDNLVSAESAADLLCSVHDNIPLLSRQVNTLSFSVFSFNSAW